MAQNRDAPAYQEYAATMLSKIPFRLSTLEARGLLFTMRLECWVNGSLPADPQSLALVLGLPEDEVSRSLSQISSFFQVVDGLLLCPELEDYRQHIAERRRKQSEGGKVGAAKKMRNRKPSGRRSNADVEGTPEGTLQVPRQGASRSLVQSSPAQHSQDQLTGEEVNGVDDWLANYDEAENF